VFYKHLTRGPRAAADNESMNRLRLSAATLALVGAALATAGPAPAAAHRPLPHTQAAGPPMLRAYSLCGTSCGSFSTTTGSRGLLRQSATGVTWGKVVGLATVRMTARGPASLTVTGSSRRWREGGTRVYRGRGMTLLASGTWTVAVKGADIRLSTVARGSAYAAGTGRYYLNGGRARAWSSRGTSLSLRK
jgi:hypothetical protein